MILYQFKILISSFKSIDRMHF